MARDFSLALASKDHPRASEWLENIAVDEQDDLLLRWKLAYELRKMDWEAVNQWVEKTPAPKHSQNDWNYWRGRSEFALGNSARGNEVFQNLAKERSYYGFLASAHLGSQPNLKQENYAFTPSVIGDLSQHPRALIAYELWQADRHLSARREWNHLKRSLDHDQKKHLAVVAHQWGWHEQAIFTLAETGLHDAVNMRFPIAFQSLMQQESASSQLDLTLSLAIARKESAFMPDARSRVGAVGLMQIMPQTARYITRKEKLPNMYSRQLTDPLVNIKLGTRYLKRLIDEHEGNAVLATASYNAGKHKVAKWLPKDSTLPADIWIEVVPYKETRSYIKNVLAYQQIYRSLLGKEDNYFNELIHMEIQSLP